MSYVAIKGGTEAIGASKRFYSRLVGHKVGHKPDCGQQKNLLFAVDRIMGEGALYSEKLGEEALARSGGDMLEAAFYLRAHRSSCRRIGLANVMESGAMRVLRRVSSAFKDIAGGQILGPSSDYVVKLLRGTKNDPEDVRSEGGTINQYLPSALDTLRSQDKIMRLDSGENSPFDITRSSPLPPYPRSAIMQVMARGETGAMLGFSYTSMRGYGDVHPTIGDLRIGTMKVSFTHPFTGKPVIVGEIRVTAVESLGSFKTDERDGKLRLATGFGFCFGFNETKAIAMSILDMAMTYPSYSVGEHSVATSPEMVLHHVDGIESMGFANHFKLPHYVTFQADLQTFNQAQLYNEQD